MRITTSLLILAAALSGAAVADDKAQLRAALKDTAPQGDWNYDDLAAGFAQAKSTGRPLMALFRCVL